MPNRLLQPPEITDINEPIIFIAGPIQGAPDWQQQAITHIHYVDPDIIVASPRKDYADGTFVYEKQVDWETHHLQLAGKLGVVAFWLALQEIEAPGRSYAQTSRFELAEWKMHHQFEGTKLTVGIEEGFGNARYIHRRLSQDCPNIRITNTLEAMCDDAVQLLRTS